MQRTPRHDRYKEAWWNFLHRIITMIRRIRRFIRKQNRRRSTRLRRSPEVPNQASHSPSKCFETPTLPAFVWVAHVLPYLDRISQDQLSATCKDISQISKEYGLDGAAWPNGKFRFKRPILIVAFSPDSSILAIVPANSKSVWVWNRRRGYDQTLKGHGGIVSHATFCPSTGLLASCSRTDGTIRIWSNKKTASNDSSTKTDSTPTQYRCVRQLVLRVFAMRYIRFSPCGEMIASWGNDRMIRLDRLGETTESSSLVGSTPWRLRLGIQCCDCVVFPKKSNRTILAHTFNNEQVRLWDWERQTSIELRDADRTVAVGDYDAYLTSMALLDLPDGREYLVVGCRVATVKLWDLNDFSCVRSFHLGSGWSAVVCMIFSQDGSTMACTGEGSEIRVFDVQSANCVATLKDHKDRVESLSFSSDGLTLSSAGCDRTMRLWTLQDRMSTQPT